jgi:hypothetical protein
LANINNEKSKIIPAVWAYSIAFSLGFLFVIISYNRKITCPPSNAGIGRIFINASTIEKNAVMFQNLNQSHSGEKTLPKVINPPRDS